MWHSKDFIGQKPSTIKYFKKNGVTYDTIAEFCTMVGMPITVTCEFLIEEFPEHEEMLQEKIKDIKDFYGID